MVLNGILVTNSILSKLIPWRVASSGRCTADTAVICVLRPPCPLLVAAVESRQKDE